MEDESHKNDHFELAKGMVKVCPNIREICKPLFSVSPINLYAYCEIHLNGQLYLTSTHKSIIQDSICSGEIEDEFKSYLKYCKQQGSYLSDFYPDLQRELINVFSRISKNKRGHQYIIVDKEDDSSVKFHFFYGPKENRDVKLFYFNNPVLTKYFCRYSSKMIQPFLNKIEPWTITSKNLKTFQDYITNVEPMEIPVPQFLISLTPHLKLSKRQWELVNLYLAGKNSEETAKLLGISKATVETHFIRLKTKLGVQSKQQIIAELFKFGIRFPERG